MAETIPHRHWGVMALFAALSLGVLFVQILPLRLIPPQWGGPDLLACLACAVVLRRPESAPAWLIALVFLLADLLLQRPPGLWAALMLLSCEVLRSRIGDLREAGFWLEWLTVAVVLTAATLIYRLALTVTAVEQAPAGQAALHLTATLLAYPAVALLLYFVFGLRKAAPGEVDDRGKRL